MQKILILSGKGGTGKTTVASSFIHLLDAKSYGDCDVDAPNLHITNPQKVEPVEKDFEGLPKAKINNEACVLCGECIKRCNFDAISIKDGKIYINQFMCEGCGVCEYVCGKQAISLGNVISGKTYTYNCGDNSDDNLPSFSTATLKMGEGASGKLVSQVKSNMKVLKKDDIAIIDGSPGIGCPVIASISGVDMALIVTEPSVSGMSDLMRIINALNHFGTKYAVCINRFDINKEKTLEIEEYLKKNNIEMVGKIPFDKAASSVVNEGMSIVDIDCSAGYEVRKILDRVLEILEQDNI